MTGPGRNKLFSLALESTSRGFVIVSRPWYQHRPHTLWLQHARNPSIHPSQQARGPKRHPVTMSAKAGQALPSHGAQWSPVKTIPTLKGKRRGQKKSILSVGHTEASDCDPQAWKKGSESLRMPLFNKKLRAPEESSEDASDKRPWSWNVPRCAG